MNTPKDNVTIPAVFANEISFCVLTDGSIIKVIFGERMFFDGPDGLYSLISERVAVAIPLSCLEATNGAIVDLVGKVKKAQTEKIVGTETRN